MDFQNRGGSKFGAQTSTANQANIDRRERLRKLALETIDLAKDPVLFPPLTLPVFHAKSLGLVRV
jgi:splicing factor 3A subunit 2